MQRWLGNGIDHPIEVETAAGMDEERRLGDTRGVQGLEDQIDVRASIEIYVAAAERPEQPDHPPATGTR
jgi:hypothetical protein